MRSDVITKCHYSPLCHVIALWLVGHVTPYRYVAHDWLVFISPNYHFTVWGNPLPAVAPADGADKTYRLHSLLDVI